MTEDAVRRALAAAVREAFNMGLRANGQRGANVETLRQQAMTYAQDLVLPMTALAVDEAREEGFIAARRDQGNAT